MPAHGDRKPPRYLQHTVVTHARWMYNVFGCPGCPTDPSKAKSVWHRSNATVRITNSRWYHRLWKRSLTGETPATYRPVPTLFVGMQGQRSMTTACIAISTPPPRAPLPCPTGHRECALRAQRPLRKSSGLSPIVCVCMGEARHTILDGH